MATKVSPALVKAIAGVPLFAECSSRQQRAIAAGAKLLTRSAGTTIVEQGTGGIAFFVILEGDVDIIQDGTTIASLKTGEYFGELALLVDSPRNTTAVAATAVELAVFTTWDFKPLVLNDAELAYHLMQTVARRDASS